MQASTPCAARVVTTGISHCSKAFRLGEDGRFEFRAESFNVWNHTQFDAVSNGLGASNFGQVTSAFDPRVFQFGGKLYF